jgi:hypothetical protein
MQRSLLAGILLLSLCACAARDSTALLARNASETSVRFLPPLPPNPSKQLRQFLYYIPFQDTLVAKIRVSDGKIYKHKFYGNPGARDIALDSQGHLYESAYDGTNSTVVELDSKLQIDRTIQVKGGEAEAVSVDQQGVAYVAWHSNDGREVAIEEFSKDASGPAAPIRTISGSQTALKYPEALTLDSAGVLYVADYELGEVLVYAAQANGNVAPIRVIGGDQTGVTMPTNLILGADGNMYVSNQLPGSDEAGPVSWILSAWRRKIHLWDRNSAPERTLPSFGVS